MARIWDPTDIIRIQPMSYGRNWSYQIELNRYPYRAILKTYRSKFAHDRQKNETASLKYLVPFLKGTVPEIYGEASKEEDTPWLLLEWKEGQCLAGVFGDLCPEERSDVMRQCGQLCRKLHSMKSSGVGPMTIEGGLNMSWVDYFFGQCDRMLNAPIIFRTIDRRLIDRVRDCLMCDGHAILRDPIPSIFLHYDFTVWNIQVEKRDGRWEISGLFDFESAIRGDVRMDLVWTEHIHKVHMPIAIDRESFSTGYGENIDSLPLEIRKLYSIYRQTNRICTLSEFGNKAEVAKQLTVLDGLFHGSKHDGS